MSEEVNPNAEGGAQDDNGGAGVDLKALQNELEALKAKNKELMDETKNKSSKLKKFEDEKAALEEQKLKEEGKHKELLERETKKNLELSQKFKDRILDTQLELAAREAGCRNLSAFKKLAGNYENEVKFDEHFNADKDTLNAFISKFKEEYKDLALFETPAKPVQDGGTGGDPKPAPKSFAEQAVAGFEALRGQS